MDPPAPVTAIQPPWTLKGTIYLFVYYISPSSTLSLPSFTFSPLETTSPFAAGKAKGGLGMVQVIRYSESPVGPYDELLLVPGEFGYEAQQGEQKVEKSNLKITRIWVSQKQTCWNGRKNWNIPKHLARFEFKTLPGDATHIKVFPHDTTGDDTEAAPSSVPFFTATYKPISFLPYFPLTTSLSAYVGIDLHIVQPPLPSGKSKHDELAGTDKWCRVLPLEYTKKASLGWWDLKQDVVGKRGSSVGDGAPTEGDRLLDNTDEGTVNEASGFENWWPGLGRWRIGVRMDNATIEMLEGESWK